MGNPARVGGLRIDLDGDIAAPESLRRTSKKTKPADFVARKGAFNECRRLLLCAHTGEKKGVTLP
ncbi:hypothetical protein P0D88_38190 [Paraburkholderia sp. RL18-103-BIB-C]|jgi:hypothetical protein|uniref:hypothetical protein n=1 Tax=unclassified Paraburkholderia TaxID=2615204 RepID=UPI0038BE003B